MAYFYILFSEKNNKYYVGSTDDLERRFSEHNRGQTKSTASGRPWKLVFKQEFVDTLSAKRLEIKIKSWKSRRIIENTIKTNS